MADEPLKLARWIQERYPYAVLDQLTHLKLQKLGFYCFGAALAFGHEDEVAGITFEAWDHGPVNREVYREYRAFGASRLPESSSRTVEYSAETEQVMLDVLRVYGVLDAWTLREESHLELPWIEARERGDAIISNDRIKAHFSGKFRGDAIRPPEHLLNAGSFSLDGIPVRSYSSLHEIAGAIGSRFERRA
jgi:uncharacterized phage-associated protein